MGFINKLERRFGKYAIKNLILYVLIAYAIGYILSTVSMETYALLILDPELVCRGQVWRLFTWICTIPQQLNVFVILMFFFYYWIGITLEACWGTFRYNLYILSGWFFMTAGAMLFYVITMLIDGQGISLNMSTYYINLTSFLACATIFPNAGVLLMGIIPVKMKWIAIVDLVVIGYNFVQSLSVIIRYNEIECYIYTGHLEESYIANCMAIGLSLLNFALFYFGTRNYKKYAPTVVRNKRRYNNELKMAKKSDISKHKCAICGRTENDDVRLAFRFCSKCEGNYEYCTDHLYTHEHVGKDNEE